MCGNMLCFQRRLILWILLPMLTVSQSHSTVSNVDVIGENTITSNDLSLTPTTTHIADTEQTIATSENVEPVQHTAQHNIISTQASLSTDQSQPSTQHATPVLTDHIQPSFSDISATSLDVSATATLSVDQSTVTDQSEALLQPTHSIEADVTNGQQDNIEPLVHHETDESSYKTDVDEADTDATADSPTKHTPSVLDLNFTQNSEAGGITDEPQTLKVAPADSTPSADTGPPGAHFEPEIMEGSKVTGSEPTDKAEEGLTFNEWKQKVAEAEKGKQDGDVEGAAVPVKAPVKQRKKKNYASFECGAKVIASNPEADNAKSILNSNKDDYMNTPCKVKKWFVIELCEPMQAHSMDVASLELFSSQPKKIKVMLSDRYPTKDWQIAGDFDTRDERSLQTFPVTEAQDYFAKYVRVEISEHYGDEHFCPLTIFRVLGIGVTDLEVEDQPGHMEDDDDDDDDDQGTADYDPDPQSNLFDGVKKTVIGLVKRVLNVEGDGNANANGTDVNMTESGNNASVAETSSEDNTAHLPCLPDADAGGNRFAEDRRTVTSSSLPQPPLPGETNIVRILKDDEQPETNTSFLDLIYGYPYMSSATTLNHLVHRCTQNCDSYLRKLDATRSKSSYNFSKLCGYMFLWLRRNYHCTAYKEMEAGMVYVSAATSNAAVTSVSDSSQSSISKDIHTTNANTDTPPDAASHVTQASGVISPSQSSPAGAETSQPPSSHDNIHISEPVITSSRSEGEEERSPSSKIHTVSISADEILHTQTGSSSIYTHQSVPSQTSTITAQVETKTRTASMETEISSTISVVIDPSPTLVIDDKISVSGAKEVTPSLPHSWKPDTKDLMEDRTDTGDQAATKQSDVVVTASLAQAIPSSVPIDSSEQSLPSSKLPEVTITDDLQRSPDVTMDTDDLEDLADDLEITSTTTETPPTAKSNTTVIDEKVVIDGGSVRGDKGGNLGLVRVPVIPSGKRESAIMRLSNRMKILEQNVSLSSRFLEELSQRYKKQSEDMMKMLNKTVAKISNMTVEADVKSKLHEDEMSAMATKLENLTAVVNRLTHRFDTLNQQVTDRHMIWTTIEILIILVMYVFLHFRRKQVALPPEVRTLIEAMPTKPGSQGLQLPVRRNSISGPATPSKEKKSKEALALGGGLHRFSSETMLASKDSACATKTDFHKQANDGCKKKKKKKTKCSDAKLFSYGSGPTQCENILLSDTSHVPSQKQYGSLLQVQPNKHRSNSLGTSDLDKGTGTSKGTGITPLESMGKDRNGPHLGGSGARDGKGAKQSSKGLSKKPPMSSGGAKISPKLMTKVNKNLGEYVTIGANGSNEDKKPTVKGHRRQKSLPKQHYSTVETVGEREANSRQFWGSDDLPCAPCKPEGCRKLGEMKESISLPDYQTHIRRTSNEHVAKQRDVMENGYNNEAYNVNDNMGHAPGSRQSYPFVKGYSGIDKHDGIQDRDRCVLDWKMGHDDHSHGHESGQDHFEGHFDFQGQTSYQGQGELSVMNGNTNGHCSDSVASLTEYGPQRSDMVLRENHDQNKEDKQAGAWRKMFGIFKS